MGGTRTCERAMMTEAPDMKPEMTECDRKFVSQPSFRMPTIVYRQPARNATCQASLASQFQVMAQQKNLGYARGVFQG